MRHAENHRLVFIKFGCVYLVETQESGYKENRVDFPRTEPGAYFTKNVIYARMGY
jgi:hypothetical protein